MGQEEPCWRALVSAVSSLLGLGWGPQGLDTRAGLGSGLLGVQGAFSCSGGLPGTAWLFCWFDPACLLGLGPNAHERAALAAGDDGQLGGLGPSPSSPHPRAGRRHGMTVSDERGFSSRGWAKVYL